MQSLKYNKASQRTMVYFIVLLEELGLGGGEQNGAYIGTNTTSYSTPGTHVLKISFSDYY